MEKIIVNKVDSIWMEDLDEFVKFTIHYIVLYEDARDEVAGKVVATIEGHEYYNEFEFDLWGNGEEEDEYKKDYDACYICVPTIYEDEDEEDEVEVLHFSELC